MAEKSNPNMLFANFNQDFSCISVGTKKGYSIMNCDPFGRVYSMTDGPRSIVEMLFCTSLIALVGDASPSSSSLHPSSLPSSKSPQSSTSPGSTPPGTSSSRRHLQIVNTKRQSTICELLFPSSILRVALNRKTLIVVLATEIYIYDISNMKLQHVVETAPNPEGICALSTGSGLPSGSGGYGPGGGGDGGNGGGGGSGSGSAGWLVYPGSVPSHDSGPASKVEGGGGRGDVLIFSTRSFTVATAIQAHTHPISALALSPSGSLLATSSEQGTVIRVWSMPTVRGVQANGGGGGGGGNGGERLYEFRRGSTPARIYDLAFNSVGTLLGVCSSNGTVHVFRLGSASSHSSSHSSQSPSSASHSSTTSHSTSKPGSTPTSDPHPSPSKEAQPDDGGQKKKSRALRFLPSSVKTLWDAPQRHFAALSLPAGGVRSVVGFSSTMPEVMVLSAEGYLYVYAIDLEKGGEGGLVRQYSLLDSVDLD